MEPARQAAHAARRLAVAGQQDAVVLLPEAVFGEAVELRALFDQQHEVGIALLDIQFAGFDDPLQWLAAVGGLEIAAICGAILAARMGRTPVLLDGYVVTAAAAVLHKIDPRALDHCQVAHLSAEPAHRLLCEKIGKKPILDLGLRLGEGTGAALAVPVLKAAVDCHTGMATFEQAGVSGPV